MAKNTLTTAFYQTEKDLKHPIPVRAYKDRIFRMIFKEKRALLALYNAMNDTAYQKQPCGIFQQKMTKEKPQRLCDLYGYRKC